MTETLSDPDFLREMEFKEEKLANLNNADPVYSVSVDFMTTCQGGWSNYFTHDPVSDIKKGFLSNIKFMRDEHSQSLKGYTDDLKSPHAISSESSIKEMIEELKDKIKFIDTIPAWCDFIAKDDCGHFIFDYGKGTRNHSSYELFKVKIADIKALYLFNNKSRHPEKIISGDDFYKSFVWQSIDAMLFGVDDYYSKFKVPSVEDVKNKHGIITSMFEAYKSIPVGSLISIDHPRVNNFFARKTTSDIIPGDSESGIYAENSYCMAMNSMVFGYNPEISQTKEFSKSEALDTFILNPSIKMIPKTEEKKTIDDAVTKLPFKFYEHDKKVLEIYAALDIN